MLREEKTSSQVAAAYGVQPNQVAQWRDVIAFVLEAMPRVCNGDQSSHFTSPQHLTFYNQRRLHQALN